MSEDMYLVEGRQYSETLYNTFLYQMNIIKIF